MDSLLDQTSPGVVSDKPFKKLRKDPDNLTFEDFREIFKTIEMSSAARNDHDRTYYRANCEVGRYYYTLISHNPLRIIFNEKQLEYKIHLNNQPTRNFFQIKCTFEVLVEGKRLYDFTISYVAKPFVKFSSDQKLLKQIQAKNTNSELQKFLEYPPILQNDTIKKARHVLHKAQETAEEVKQSLEDRYRGTDQIPLTSRTDEKRRQFKKLRAVTQSQIERIAPHRRKSDSTTSEIPEGKEKVEEKSEEKETKELRPMNEE